MLMSALYSAIVARHFGDNQWRKSAAMRVLCCVQRQTKLLCASVDSNANVQKRSESVAARKSLRAARKALCDTVRACKRSTSAATLCRRCCCWLPWRTARQSTRFVSVRRWRASARQYSAWRVKMAGFGAARAALVVPRAVRCEACARLVALGLAKILVIVFLLFVGLTLFRFSRACSQCTQKKKKQKNSCAAKMQKFYTRRGRRQTFFLRNDWQS